MSEAFVVDTSALLAVVLGEPDAEHYAAKLAGPGRKVVSALTLFESSVVAERRAGLEGRVRLDRLVTSTAFEVVAFDVTMLDWARDAFRRFGKGRHAAALNLGDCVAYATARAGSMPLLFKGKDFEQTDLARA